MRFLALYLAGCVVIPLSLWLAFLGRDARKDAPDERAYGDWPAMPRTDGPAALPTVSIHAHDRSNAR